MGIVKAKNIRVYGNHGCLPQETEVGQYFFVDVEIHSDFKIAALNDELSGTIDYVDINRIVVSEMKKPSKLIETVGYKIMHELTDFFKTATFIEVVITKPNPPINGDVDHVSITVNSNDL